MPIVIRTIPPMTSTKCLSRVNDPILFPIWRPAIVKMRLDKYGLALKKIYITGHHPERFFRAGQQKNPGSFLSANIRLFSRIAGLGDTFETIAVKNRELPENE